MFEVETDPTDQDLSGLGPIIVSCIFFGKFQFSFGKVCMLHPVPAGEPHPLFETCWIPLQNPQNACHHFCRGKKWKKKKWGFEYT